MIDPAESFANADAEQQAAFLNAAADRLLCLCEASKRSASFSLGLDGQLMEIAKRLDGRAWQVLQGLVGWADYMEERAKEQRYRAE